MDNQAQHKYRQPTSSDGFNHADEQHVLHLHVGRSSNRFPRWSRRTIIIITMSILALLLITGGSYALYFGPHNSATDTSSSAINLNKGLVGWWKLNGNTKDATPYGNNGTVNGATLTTGPSGAANSAYSFNGTSNTIDMGPTSNLNMGSSDFSISFWLDPASLPSPQDVLSKWSGTGGFSITTVGNRLLMFLNNTDTYRYSNTGALTAGVWTHVVFIKKSTTNFDVYVNGTLDDGSWTGTVPSSIGSVTNDFEIGLGRYSTYYDGSISDVRIYDRALSTAEVTALYKESSPGISSDSGENGLVGWWKLNGNAKDSTPYGDNGTLINAPTPASDRESHSNGAYSFNGTNQYIEMSSNTALNPANGSMTWSVWFETTNSGSQFLYRDSGSCNDNGFILESGVASSGKIDGYLSYYPSGTGCSGTEDIVRVTASATTDDGKWHLANVVLNRPSDTLTLYIDGQSVSSVSAAVLAGINLTAGSFPVLGSSYGASAFFNGSMSDMRVYNRALSASEVSNLYNSYNSQIGLGGSGQGGSVSLGEGLVGYWPLTGNTKDETPYANNFTLGSGTSYTTDRFGQANSSLSFPSTSAIGISGSNNLAPFSTTALSVNLWLDITSYGTYYAVQPIMKGSCGSATDTFCFYVFGNYEGNNDEGRVGFYGGAGGNWTDLTGLYTLSTNQWYMITMVYTSTSGGQLYINGSPVGAYGNSGALGSNTSPVNGSFEGGNLSDMRVYNRALSTAEIQALYQEN